MIPVIEVAISFWVVLTPCFFGLTLMGVFKNVKFKLGVTNLNVMSSCYFFRLMKCSVVDSTCLFWLDDSRTGGLCVNLKPRNQWLVFVIFRPVIKIEGILTTSRCLSQGI